MKRRVLHAAMTAILLTIATPTLAQVTYLVRRPRGGEVKATTVADLDRAAPG